MQAPNPKVSLTLEELAACQHLASTHITFSLTLACPLQCAHCIVGAGPDKTKTTMPLEIAEHYATQMSALAERGIEGICFTGGEPFVARRQLTVMAEAAAANGIDVSVVTAAHWAKSAERSKQLVALFPMISCWDVSYDAHHTPWVDITMIAHAVGAIRGEGHTANIRVTYSDPLTEADFAVMQQLREINEEDCVAQAMRPVGRGADIHVSTGHGWNPWVKPCLTQGMVVRYDGTVSPCCLNLVESRGHPFDFGDPRRINLAEVHRNFATDPLLQLIRVLGFGPIQEWAAEEGLDHLLPDPVPEEVCELCTAVMHQPELAQMATRRANADDAQIKIAVLAAKLLGETEMLTSQKTKNLTSELEPMP